MQWRNKTPAPFFNFGDIYTPVVKQNLAHWKALWWISPSTAPRLMRLPSSRLLASCYFVSFFRFISEWPLTTETSVSVWDETFSGSYPKLLTTRALLLCLSIRPQLLYLSLQFLYMWSSKETYPVLFPLSGPFFFISLITSFVIVTAKLCWKHTTRQLQYSYVLTHLKLNGSLWLISQFGSLRKAHFLYFILPVIGFQFQKFQVNKHILRKAQFCIQVTTINGQHVASFCICK